MASEYKLSNWSYLFRYSQRSMAAAMTLRTVLLSLQALLSAAEPDDPQDAVVARQYKEQRKVFWQTAKHWTNIYARGPHREAELEAKVSQLRGMGFEEHKARVALSTCDWNIQRATDHLIS